MFEIKHGNYTISADPRRLDLQKVCDFILNHSYWGEGRTSEQTLRSFQYSTCIGAYFDSEQIGFARAVSDRTFFSYVFDVFVLPEHQRRGIAKALMRGLLDHPDLRNVQSWMLSTRYAHQLYEGMGFKAVEPGRYLLLKRG